MTPLNEVTVGKFCRFAGSVVYMCKNNHTDCYTLVPVMGKVPRDRKWNVKVYVYKCFKKDWVELARGWVEFTHTERRIDNLTYIENLDILKNYNKSDIVNGE